MSADHDLDHIEPEFDEIAEDGFPIGLTFAGGSHESDLLSFVERASRMAGEVC